MLVFGNFIVTAAARGDGHNTFTPTMEREWEKIMHRRVRHMCNSFFHVATITHCSSGEYFVATTITNAPFVAVS